MPPDQVTDTDGTGQTINTGKIGETDPQQQTDNNDDNNDDNFNKLWDDPSVDDDESKKKQADIQQQQQTDHADIFNKHIESLKLSDGIDFTQISTDLNQGNSESLNKAFTKVAGSVYRQALIDSSKLIDKKVEEGVSAAIKQSANAVHGTMAVDRMHSALTFTKNPAVKPIATAVLSQFIKKGKSPEEAIEGVRSFFTQTSKISAKDLGLKHAPRSRPGNHQFNDPPDDNAEEVDWMLALDI